jgi:hypothetical protein
MPDEVDILILVMRATSPISITITVIIAVIGSTGT